MPCAVEPFSQDDDFCAFAFLFRCLRVTSSPRRERTLTRTFDKLHRTCKSTSRSPRGDLKVMDIILNAIRIYMDLVKYIARSEYDVQVDRPV